MQVLDTYQDRRARAQDGHQLRDHAEEGLALMLGAFRRRLVAPVRRDLQHGGDEGRVIGHSRVVEQLGDLAEPDVGRIVPGDRRGAPEEGEDRLEGGVAELRLARQGDHPAGSRSDPLGEFDHEPGLADPCLAGDQHCTTRPAGCLVPDVPEGRNLRGATLKGWQRSARPRREEPVLDLALAQYPVRGDRLGEPLQRHRAERAAVEEVRNQSVRAFGDHEGVGLGDRLQPRGEVRSAAERARLARHTRAQQVADHHHPGGHAHPRLRAAAGQQVEARHLLDDRETRAYCAFRRMFARERIAEIDQYAVAEILRHRATVALDNLRAAPAV